MYVQRMNRWAGALRHCLQRVYEPTTRIPVPWMLTGEAALEFLLADSAARSQSQTTNRILHALRCSDYDTDTLSRAMDALPSDKALRLLRLLEIRLVAG